MSREPLPPDDGGPQPPDPHGRLSTTSPGSLAGFALVGLVLGWLVRPVSVRVGAAAPTVGWLPVVALVFVAAVVGSLAWSTYRMTRRHQRLEAHRAVNRLVLAKACALSGALIAGAYGGFALSWVGLTAALARERVVASLVAAAAAVVLVVGALLLERACRVGKDDR